MKGQINEKKKAGKKINETTNCFLGEKKIKWINLWQD